MPGILDSFVVALGLDRTQYDREIKRYQDDRKRLTQEEEKSNRDVERSQGRLIQNMRNLRNETAGFLFALAGANSLRQFSASLITSDAAVGRLAANLGVAVENLSAWGGAVKTVGGDANSAYNSFRTLSSMYQNLLLTGSSGNDADLKGLGLTADDLRNPEQALLKLADRASQLGPGQRAQFTERARRIGIDESMITLLARGRQGVQGLLEEQRRLGTATEESARKAQEFEAALSRVETKLADFGRTVLMEFGPGAEKFLTWLSDGREGTYSLAAAFGVAAIATTGWLGVLGLLTVGLGGLVSELGGVKNTLDTVSMGFEALTIRAQIWYHQKRADLYGSANPEARLRELETVSELNQRLVDMADSDTAARAGRSSFRYDQTTGQRGGPLVQRFGLAPSFRGDGGAPGGMGGNRDGNPARKPRGARAVALEGNNPGGINDGAFARGQPGYAGNNGRYAAFWTMQDGINAQRALLASYVRRGIDTPYAIAHRWAPSSDGNDPNGYAARIARQMGIGIHDRIGPGQLETFGHHQAVQENSRYGRVRPGPPPRTNMNFRPVSQSTTTTIGEINIQTAATDADGIARDMRSALVQRGVISQAATGLVS